eukprot:3933435-Rhodomonas_salina.1
MDPQLPPAGMSSLTPDQLDQHLADARQKLTVAQLQHQDSCLALGTAEWAVYEARLALHEVARELHLLEVAVWRAEEESRRRWGMHS